MAFEGLSDRLSDIFKRLRGHGKLTEKDVEEVMKEIRMALLEADVNYKVAKSFVKRVSERAVGEEVMNSLTPAQQVIKIVNDELVVLMGPGEVYLNTAKKPPTIIMMVGLQGSGKTTHSGKLAKMLKKQGHRPLLVACDIYRPAAIDQLQVVGKQADVPVFEMGTENPTKIATAAIKQAKDYGNDFVILDTAGRLHIDETLMDELKDLKTALIPDDILLVVDAMTGQDAVNVAKAFDDALGIDGVILTKLDGDTRGGAALSVKEVTGKPIFFVGTGEKLDDLETFYPDRMASRILGMGDMLTLIEKASEEMDLEQSEKAMNRLRQNKFTMDDLLEQMEQMNKLGSIQDLLAMIPGGNKVNADDIDEKQMDRTKAIIRSMTPAERERPEMINPSRKRRIAQGSGTNVTMVNQLLKQFEQTKKMMKQMTGFGKKGKRRFRMPGF